jgi:hypothetical protein
MRSVRLLALLFLAFTISPSAAAAQPRAAIPVVPMDRYQWMGQLVGSCWRGTNVDGKEMDTQCYSVQFGRFLRATTRMKDPRGGKNAPVEGEFLMAWNPKNGQYDAARWSSDGAFRVEEATLYRGAFRFWKRERDGSDPRERTIWRQYGKDRYEVTLERREGDVWHAVKTTTYDRVESPR